MIIISFLNLTLLLQLVVSYQFIKKQMRFYTFQTFHLTDAILFIINIVLINWYMTSILVNTGVDGLSLDEQGMRIIANINQNQNFHFTYLFGVNTFCLVIHLMYPL